jgi:hypothetical protein
MGTPIAVAKSGAEGKGSEQRPRNRLRGSKRGSSDSKNGTSEPRDLAGACCGGKFVVSRAAEAYNAQVRSPNRKFRMKRTMGPPRIARLGFYIGAVVLAAGVWKIEVLMQSRMQVYGSLIDSLTQLQEKQLEAFLDMNRLVTTLGTTLLGAMGFFLASSRKAHSLPRELWAAFGSAVCVGLSLYFGYHAYEDILLMLQNKTFDLTSPQISWDRHAHFNTFLLGVFLFADFAFHELSKEDGREHSRDVAGS